jgi:hypothetical protein
MLGVILKKVLLIVKGILLEKNLLLIMKLEIELFFDGQKIKNLLYFNLEKLMQKVKILSIIDSEIILYY